MLVNEAKSLAWEWTQRYAQDHRILGAYFNGSVTEMEETDVLPVSSDVDINLVISGEEPTQKPGKLLYQGALLEAGFVRKESLFPAEKLLSTYEIVGAFRGDNIILDPDGLLQPLQRTVSAAFAEPRWVRARMEAVTEKIKRGTEGYHMGKPVLQGTNPWLFPAGICTHLLMVGGLVNPTVRLRYLKLRPLLHANGYAVLYEKLLGLLGCENFTVSQTQNHLRELVRTFDIACRYAPETHFPFSNDISSYARAVVVDGSEDLIRKGNHREAVFWMAATSVRCLLILAQTDAEEYRRRYPAFLSLLTDLGADTNEKIATKIQQIHCMLPELGTAAEALYEKTVRQGHGMDLQS